MEVSLFRVYSSLASEWDMDTPTSPMGLYWNHKDSSVGHWRCPIGIHAYTCDTVEQGVHNYTGYGAVEHPIGISCTHVSGYSMGS
jgi:hypothetical protein